MVKGGFENSNEAERYKQLNDLDDHVVKGYQNERSLGALFKDGPKGCTKLEVVKAMTPILRKLARLTKQKFDNNPKIEFDDLFQEAYIGYAHAMKTYDPKKGKISTHIWWCVSAQLKR